MRQQVQIAASNPVTSNIPQKTAPMAAPSFPASAQTITPSTGTINTTTKATKQILPLRQSFSLSYSLSQMDFIFLAVLVFEIYTRASVTIPSAVPKAGHAATTTGVKMYTPLIVSFSSYLDRTHAKSSRRIAWTPFTGYPAPGGALRKVLAWRARPSAQLRRRFRCSSIVLDRGTVWRRDFKMSSVMRSRCA